MIEFVLKHEHEYFVLEHKLDRARAQHFELEHDLDRAQSQTFRARVTRRLTRLHTMYTVLKYRKTW